MARPSGVGLEDYSRAVHLLKQAAVHTGPGETAPGKGSTRDSVVAMAQSMEYFEAALKGTYAYVTSRTWLGPHP